MFYNSLVNYRKILNPITNKLISINSKNGIKVLKNYIKNFKKLGGKKKTKKNICIVSCGGGGDALAALITGFYYTNKRKHDNFYILASDSNTLSSIKYNVHTDYCNLPIDREKQDKWLNNKDKEKSDIRESVKTKLRLDWIGEEFYTRIGLNNKEYQTYLNFLGLKKSPIDNILKLEPSKMNDLDDDKKLKIQTLKYNKNHPGPVGPVEKNPYYGTFYTEAKIARVLGKPIYIIYGPGDGGAPNYNGIYPKNNSKWNEEELNDQLNVTKEAILKFKKIYEIDKFVLVDVGGDMFKYATDKDKDNVIDHKPELTKLGRDEFMFWAFKDLLNDRQINNFNVTIYGPGCDTHEYPINVEEKLKGDTDEYSINVEEKFKENINIGKYFINEFLKINDTDGLHDNTRANKIFVNAFKKNKNDFFDGYNRRVEIYNTGKRKNLRNYIHENELDENIISAAKVFEKEYNKPPLECPSKPKNRIFIDTLKNILDKDAELMLYSFKKAFIK